VHACSTTNTDSRSWMSRCASPAVMSSRRCHRKC